MFFEKILFFVEIEVGETEVKKAKMSQKRYKFPKFTEPSLF